MAVSTRKLPNKGSRFEYVIFSEALESGMCDVIKIRIQRMDATRSRKGNQPLDIKTSVERPILKLGLPN